MRRNLKTPVPADGRRPAFVAPALPGAGAGTGASTESSDVRETCVDRYRSTLLAYLASEGETALHGAYELGRNAIIDGLGCVEMAGVHREALAMVLREAHCSEADARIVEQAGRFLAESLSPFEMALRGFRETNAQLSRNIQELLAAEAALREQRDRLLAAETELRKQRDELLAAHQALASEQERYRDLFDFAPDGYLVTGMDGTIVEANRAAGFMLGASAESLAGARLSDWAPEQSREAMAAWIKEMIEESAEGVGESQFDILPKSGPGFPVALGVRAVRDPDGRTTGLRLLLRDVSERRRIEDQRAQLLVREQVARAQGEAARRFAFLAEVSALLVGSLDCENTLQNVANLAVPYLADSCLVLFTDGGNGTRLVSGAHGDPARARRASSLGRAPCSLNPQSRIAAAIEAGRTEILSPPPGHALDSAPAEPEPFRFLLQEGLESFLLAPMQTKSGVLGLIVLAALEPCYYGASHAALADDLASRCALAVENAQLYRAMTAERDRAEEANRAKDEFLGLLGHELRNPLAPVLGWARNLSRTRAVTENAALSQGVGAIERNALNILRLADDCLDLARISERRVGLERELLDLNRILRDAVEGLRPMAQEKELALAATLSPGDLMIVGDRTRLEQVMYNLLMNAVKYTSRGGVISVRSFKNDDVVEVEIKDTGIGIAPEFLEQVFQPFRRGGREWHSSDASLGLGLAIARKIVELHGGAIWAESPGMGGGSVFRVSLRAAPTGVQIAPRPLGVCQERSDAASVRVLLIDDHKDARELMKLELESLGYIVLTAPDGQTGLDTAVRCAPEVIVSDLKLPVIDGFELIRRARQSPGLASIPAIALTGLGLRRDMEAALAAGYDAYMNKPAEAADIADLAQKLLSQRRGGAAPR